MTLPNLLEVSEPNAQSDLRQFQGSWAHQSQVAKPFLLNGSLKGATLVDMGLDRMNLLDATLEGCHLLGINSSGTHAADVRFENCHFKDSSFSDAVLRRVTFSHCVFQGGEISLSKQVEESISIRFEHCTFLGDTKGFTSLMNSPEAIFVQCVFIGGELPSRLNGEEHLLQGEILSKPVVKTPERRAEPAEPPRPAVTPPPSASAPSSPPAPADSRFNKLEL